MENSIKLFVLLAFMISATHSHCIFAQTNLLDEMMAESITAYRDSILHNNYNPYYSPQLKDVIVGYDINYYLYLPDFSKSRTVDFLDTTFCGIMLHGNKIQIYQLSLKDSTTYWQKAQTYRLKNDQSIRLIMFPNIELYNDTICITLTKINLSKERKNRKRLLRNWRFAFSDWCTYKWIYCNKSKQWELVDLAFGGV